MKEGAGRLGRADRLTMVKKLIHLMTNALVLPILPSKPGAPRDSAPRRGTGSGEAAALLRRRRPGHEGRGGGQGTSGVEAEAGWRRRAVAVACAQCGSVRVRA